MNATKDGRISWEYDSSFTSDLYEEVECCQNWLHEVTTLNCNMMVISLQRVTTKAREMPIDEGTTNVEVSLDKFESVVLEQN